MALLYPNSDTGAIAAQTGPTGWSAERTRTSIDQTTRAAGFAARRKAPTSGPGSGPARLSPARRHQRGEQGELERAGEHGDPRADHGRVLLDHQSIDLW